MTLLIPKTLRWRLIGRLAMAQGGVLIALLAAFTLAVSIVWADGQLGAVGPNRALARALSEAITRAPNGRLMVEMTPAMRHLLKNAHPTWFIVEDQNGSSVIHGHIPEEVKRVLPSTRMLTSATIGLGDVPPSRAIGLVEWVATRAGRLRVIVDAQGPTSPLDILGTLQALTEEILILVAIMVMSTLAVTPLVVRRALAGVSDLATQAARIDIRQTNVRLPESNVPEEVRPLVTAVNAALDRLDSGYELHKRFLSDAAHELRTPIAILRTRLSGLPKGAERNRLIEDATRLEVLAGQLLDLQRLDQAGPESEPVDLVAVAQQVVLDLAPLAFAAGYEMTFDTDADNVTIEGDEGAIQRAITNLVQNAIDHGGRRGVIAVSVSANGTIAICDDGDGIPAEQRDNVFQPFRRLTHGGRGAGLGLDLVQRTMRHHGGYAEVCTGEKGGACMRIIFPNVTASSKKAPTNLDIL